MTLPVDARSEREGSGPERDASRWRRDRCPGVVRPWPAEDGALVRVRLVGGRIAGRQLAGLSAVAQEYGDGDLHLTSRANLQLRALREPHESVVEAIEALGLLPSRSHDQVRNVMVSPLSGIEGGRVDMRPVARELERLLLADPRLAALPGKFLFVLDDGRGDLHDQRSDITAVALDATSVQVRVGSRWGESASLANTARLLVVLAQEFLAVRGDGPDAPWHVDELESALMPEYDADLRVPAPTPPPPPAPWESGDIHREVPGGVITPAMAAELAAHDQLVITPWRSVILA